MDFVFDEHHLRWMTVLNWIDVVPFLSLDDIKNLTLVSKNLFGQIKNYVERTFFFASVGRHYKVYDPKKMWGWKDNGYVNQSSSIERKWKQVNQNVKEVVMRFRESHASSFSRELESLPSNISKLHIFGDISPGCSDISFEHLPRLEDLNLGFLRLKQLTQMKFPPLTTLEITSQKFNAHLDLPKSLSHLTINSPIYNQPLLLPENLISLSVKSTRFCSELNINKSLKRLTLNSTNYTHPICLEDMEYVDLNIRSRQVRLKNIREIKIECDKPEDVVFLGSIDYLTVGYFDVWYFIEKYYSENGWIFPDSAGGASVKNLKLLLTDYSPKSPEEVFRLEKLKELGILKDLNLWLNHIEMHGNFEYLPPSVTTLKVSGVYDNPRKTKQFTIPDWIKHFTFNVRRGILHELLILPTNITFANIRIEYHNQPLDFSRLKSLEKLEICSDDYNDLITLPPSSLKEFRLKCCSFNQSLELPEGLEIVDLNIDLYNHSLTIPTSVVSLKFNSEKFDNILVLPNGIRDIELNLTFFDHPLLIPPSTKHVKISCYYMTSILLIMSNRLATLHIKALNLENPPRFPKFVLDFKVDIKCVDKLELLPEVIGIYKGKTLLRKAYYEKLEKLLVENEDTKCIQ